MESVSATRADCFVVVAATAAARGVVVALCSLPRADSMAKNPKTRTRLQTIEKKEAGRRRASERGGSKQAGKQSACLFCLFCLFGRMPTKHISKQEAKQKKESKRKKGGKQRGERREEGRERSLPCMQTHTHTQRCEEPHLSGT